MTILEFEKNIKMGGTPPVRNEPPHHQDEQSHVYQNQQINTIDLKKLVLLYKKAYVNRMRIKELFNTADSLCEKAKEGIRNAVGCEEYENGDFKLSQVKRVGNVDWHLMESKNPSIKIDQYRKESTIFWTIKLKVKE